MKLQHRAKEKPRRSGVPASRPQGRSPHAAGSTAGRPGHKPASGYASYTVSPHERAGRAKEQTQHAAGSTASLHLGGSSQRHRPSYTVSPAGQRLKRSRPAVGAAQAVGRHKKAPPGTGDSSGAKVGVGHIRNLARCRTTNKFGPLKSVTQADSVAGGAYLAPSPCHG